MPDSTDKPVGALDLEDIAYERVPVRVTILGQRYVFDAWVYGPGCPGRITSQFARLRSLMGRTFHENGGAFQEFLTDALRVVFEAPADQYEAIDLLAGQTERGRSILEHLKWLEPIQAEKSEDDADPEAEGGASTTDGSSPTSVLPSAVSAPTAAAG